MLYLQYLNSKETLGLSAMDGRLSESSQHPPDILTAARGRPHLTPPREPQLKEDRMLLL